MNIQIIELRFKASLPFFQLRAEIGKPLEKLFKDWRFDPVTLKFFDIEKYQTASLECKRISITSLNQSSDDFKNLTTKVISGYFKALPIDKLIRYGYRKIFSAPLEVKFDEVVKLFHDKIYPKNEEFKNIFTEGFSDVAFLGNFTRDSFSFHFQAGPVTKDECIKRMEPHNPFKVKNKDKEITDISLFLDTDCYKENVSADNYTTLLEDSFKLTDTIQQDFIKYTIK